MRQSGSDQLSNAVLHAAWPRSISGAEASAESVEKGRKGEEGRAEGVEPFQRAAVELRCCADDLEAILAEVHARPLCPFAS